LASEKRTARHDILTGTKGKQYRFRCDLSGEVICLTNPVHAAESTEQELMSAWESEGRQHFNRCRQCGRWVSDAAYNAATLACIECSPWEEEHPSYCFWCGERAAQGRIFCEGCGHRLQYAFDFGRQKIEKVETDRVLKFENHYGNDSADPKEFGFSIEVMKNRRVCPYCGRGEAADRQICSVCGEELPKRTLFQIYREQHERCSQCDTILADYMKYCPHCGMKAEGRK